MQPGRIDSSRSAPVCFALPRLRARALSGIAALLLASCASSGPSHHRELDPIWREYSELPPVRALAIAGVLRNDRWVAGASGGHDSAAAAESMALEECRRRRQLRRMQADCRVYAIDDRVIWDGP